MGFTSFLGFFCPNLLLVFLNLLLVIFRNLYHFFLQVLGLSLFFLFFFLCLILG